MTICTLCVEIDATYSDPPIRIKLLGLRSSQGHPQFKNGTVYRHVRPTRLDKIKNFRIEVQVSPVGWQPTLARAQMRRVAGQSSQRLGFYSEDLKSAMRLPAMS